MQKSVLISVTGNGKNYVKALKKVGVNATIYTGKENLNTHDVLLLGGGEDVHPYFFNETFLGTEKVNILRDVTEFILIEQFLCANKPIIAICRGFQVVNVYLCGTLYQHLKNAQFHRSNNNKDIYHKVTSVDGSVIKSIYGKTFIVNSYHHQAIKVLSNNLNANCYSVDGVIEGAENKKLKILCTQFHPERLTKVNSACGIKLFYYFFNKFIK